MASTIFAAQHWVFVKAEVEHMTVFASAGDDGSALPKCTGSGYFESASTPPPTRWSPESAAPT